MKKAKKVVVLTIGIIFIILGFFGLVLPFLQGIIFLAVGLILLSYCSPKVRLTIKKYAEHHPHLSYVINKMEGWISKIIGEI